MSARIMMALGTYRFQLSSAAYQKLERTQEYEWSEQGRVGRLPAVQFVGPKLQSVDLDGTIYPSFAGGINQVQDMRAIAGEGKPLILIDGTGRLWGKWVITKVGETQTHFLDNGTPRKITFQISLKQYGDD